MRKLLVVLAVLLAVGLFAGVHYGWNEFPGGGHACSGTVTVKVYPWYDIECSLGNSDDPLEVYDYGESFSGSIGTITIKSNGGKVSIKASVGNNLPAGFTVLSIKLDNTDVYSQSKEFGPIQQEGLTLNASIELEIDDTVDVDTYQFTVSFTITPVNPFQQ